MSSDSDGTKLIYEKFHGQRGPIFTAWWKGFLDALDLKGDEDASLAQTALGTRVDSQLFGSARPRAQVRWSKDASSDEGSGA